MDPLMSQGLELMLVGMGVVFVFLVVLVVITTLMSALVQRFGQTSTPTVAVPAAAPESAAADVPSAAVIKAIEKAVHLHRQSSQS